MDGWIEEEGSLKKTFHFGGYTDGLDWAREIGVIADRMDHHPGLRVTMRTVDVTLTTHDAGDVVTEKDRLLAAAIDELWATGEPPLED